MLSKPLYDTNSNLMRIALLTQLASRLFPARETGQNSKGAMRTRRTRSTPQTQENHIMESRRRQRGGGESNQEREVMHWPAGWAEGNLPARTRLLRNGLRFTRAQCNTAACSPSIPKRS